MRIFSFSMFVAIVLSMPAYAALGSFTGNGADRKGPGHGAAWFLGDRNIIWCGSDGSIGRALESGLNSAANKWSDYIAKKQIVRALRAPKAFALQFVRQSSCTGADLEIAVIAEKEADVFSGSELLEQDLMNGWGKGRIWLSRAVISNPIALETQLVHQLGHLLGHDHVGGTVMAEETTNLDSEIPVHPAIDGIRELYMNLDGAVSFKSADGRVYREEDGNARITSGLRVSPLRFTAVLADTNYGDAKIFALSYSGSDVSWRGALHSRSIIRLGVLEVDGRIEQVIVRRNFDKRVEIHRLVDERPELIFEAVAE
jgi:hypothetical protein